MLKSGHRPTLLAPRLVELALQSAGLFELARTERMMIPSRIARVRRLDPIDEAAGAALWARVRPSPIIAEGLDIDVRDHTGRAMVTVEGYQTTTLPFSGDARALRRLNESLRALKEPIA